MKTVKFEELEESVLSKFQAKVGNYVDIVATSNLNSAADCLLSLKQDEYDMKSTQTIYYSCTIMCQLNLAYVNYERKVPYT